MADMGMIIFSAGLIGCVQILFLSRFSPIQVTHLPRFGSDHVVVLIHLEAPSNESNRRKKRLFRFEEVWAKDDICEGAVRRSWCLGQMSCTEKLEAMKGLDVEFEE